MIRMTTGVILTIACVLFWIYLVAGACIRYRRMRAADYHDIIERQHNEITKHATPAPRCHHFQTVPVIPYSETEPIARLCVACLAQLPPNPPAKITFAHCPDDTWIRENTWVEDRRACSTDTYMIQTGDINYPAPRL